MRLLELYAGIGGVAQALGDAGIVGAVDIDQKARRIYELNFKADYHTLELESVTRSCLEKFEADVWWMSPPCRPFTVRGRRGDLLDMRTKSLLHLAKLSCQVQPEWIIVENVPGFETSQTLKMIQREWEVAGYHTCWRFLCPSEMGWPNLRKRVFVIAGRSARIRWQPLPRYDLAIRDVTMESVTVDERRELDIVRRLPSETRDIELMKLDRVDLKNSASRAACFASSYGKKRVGSGSVVVDEDGVRFFSPWEVARILGFPKEFRMDEKLDNRSLWRLLGNSLSLACVRYILSHLPGGPKKELNWVRAS